MLIACCDIRERELQYSVYPSPLIPAWEIVTVIFSHSGLVNVAPPLHQMKTEDREAGEMPGNTSGSVRRSPSLGAKRVGGPTPQLLSDYCRELKTGNFLVIAAQQPIVKANIKSTLVT